VITLFDYTVILILFQSFDNRKLQFRHLSNMQKFRSRKQPT